MEKTKIALFEEFSDLKKNNLEFRDHLTSTIQNLSAELTANFSWVRQ
jgi:hypothetical protein